MEKNIILEVLGDDAKIPLWKLMRYEPGHSAPMSRKDADLAESIANVRSICVDSVRLTSDGSHIPKIYQVTIFCIQELTLFDVRRIITLGQLAAAVEDASD